MNLDELAAMLEADLAVLKRAQGGVADARLVAAKYGVLDEAALPALPQLPALAVEPAAPRKAVKDDPSYPAPAGSACTDSRGEECSGALWQCSCDAAGCAWAAVRCDGHGGRSGCRYAIAGHRKRHSREKVGETAPVSDRAPFTPAPAAKSLIPESMLRPPAPAAGVAVEAQVPAEETPAPPAAEPPQKKDSRRWLVCRKCLDAGKEEKVLESDITHHIRQDHHLAMNPRQARMFFADPGAATLPLAPTNAPVARDSPGTT